MEDTVELSDKLSVIVELTKLLRKENQILDVVFAWLNDGLYVTSGADPFQPGAAGFRVGSHHTQPVRTDVGGHPGR